MCVRPAAEGHPAWQYAAAAAGIVVTLLWGGSYLILRYTVDDAGITRRTLFGTRRMAWADITSASVERHETAPGIESKAVTLVSLPSPSASPASFWTPTTSTSSPGKSPAGKSRWRISNNHGSSHRPMNQGRRGW